MDSASSTSNIYSDTITLTSQLTSQQHTEQDARLALLDTLEAVLRSYESGHIPPELFQQLVEQLQVLLESKAPEEGANEHEAQSRKVEMSFCNFLFRSYSVQ